MAFQVIFTSHFQLAVRSTINKIPQIYAKRTINKLIAKIGDYHLSLADNPWMGMMEPNTENEDVVYRRIVIKPYFKVIYYIEGGKVLLYDLWDTRQDPDVLKGRL